MDALRWISYSLTLLMTGCATDQALVSQAPVSVVKVPVTVPCVSTDQIPKVPTTYMDPKAGTLQKAAQAALDLHEFEDYAATADALLQGCAKPKEKS